MIALFWIIIAFFYVKLAFWTARFLSRRAQKTKTQNLIKLSVALVFILIPTWDVLLGRLYFNYLCTTEGGIKIYRQAELPAEYWQDDGYPRSKLKKIGPANYEYAIGEKYFMFSTEKQKYSNLFRIDKHGYIIKSRGNGEVLGQYTYFRYWGGWLINSIGLHRSAVRCPKNNFLAEIFIKGH